VTAKVEAIERLLLDGVRLARAMDFRWSVDLPPKPELALGQLANPEDEPLLGTFLPRNYGFLNALIPGGRRRYAERLDEGNAEYADAMQAYADREAEREDRLRDAEEQHSQRIAAWEQQVRQRRGEADSMQRQLLAGDVAVVERGARLVLERSSYPPDFAKKFALAYDLALRALSIDYELLGPSIVPDITGYTYVQSKDEVKPKPRTDSQRKQLYTTYISNIALRSLKEIFVGLPIGVIERISFSGSVSGIDRARGSEAKFRLVSVAVGRDEFRQLSLAQVDPAQCIAALGGTLSRNPLALVPVEMVGTQTGRIGRRVNIGARTNPVAGQPGKDDVLDHRYKIVTRLGKGSYGSVFQVRDQELQRDVALKLLHPHLAEEAEDRRRFIHEARALAMVNHPFVVHVYDVNDKSKPPYFTMELITGVTLANELAPGRGLPIVRVLDITRKLCDAVDCIHRSNLVHRDIKADNILLTPEGDPRLMDFGIALADGQTRLTAAGYGMGTPESAAPEQIGGGAVTKAVDIYALGILVFHMLTGRRPFEGDIPYVLNAQVNEVPPALRSLRPDVSPALATAVRAALAKRPEDRPVSAGAFWHIAAALTP